MSEEGAFLAVEDTGGEFEFPRDDLEGVIGEGGGGDEVSEDGVEEALAAASEDDGDGELLLEEEGAEEGLLDGRGGVHPGDLSDRRSWSRRRDLEESAASAAWPREGRTQEPTSSSVA